MEEKLDFSLPEKKQKTAAEKQKAFDEVRQQVMSMLLSQKRQDVRHDYIK